MEKTLPVPNTASETVEENNTTTNQQLVLTNQQRILKNQVCHLLNNFQYHVKNILLNFFCY